MSAKSSGTENGIDCKQLIEEADPKTIKRAEWEAFEFEIKAPGIVRVINSSHETPEDHSYLVNVESGKLVACECPAFKYGDGPCKHLVAVAIREPVMKAANRPMMTDGGRVSEFNPRTWKNDRDVDGREMALKANSLACDLTDIEGAGEDFDAFCGVVKVIQDNIMKAWSEEKKQRGISNEREVIRPNERA